MIFGCQDDDSVMCSIRGSVGVSSLLQCMPLCVQLCSFRM